MRTKFTMMAIFAAGIAVTTGVAFAYLKYKTVLSEPIMFTVPANKESEVVADVVH